MVKDRSPSRSVTDPEQLLPRSSGPPESSAVLLVFQASFSPPFRNQLVDQTAARSKIGKHPAHPFCRSTTPLGLALYTPKSSATYCLRMGGQDSSLRSTDYESRRN